ncbi:hypothetical protein [Pelobacter propionicus]|uniref:Uncharacterized protein n=1 Tax=Pelobacter propionicus (strain DSM 2379 / NBRC 103807 / OttBd1) TaxID=338966 RepID=A1AKX2_PELPD|nr:hypothetical protein [Pelobacter propionicus]ABK97992.1 hypothetical protein Ppro_0358 [Pelobacter propionicus DSM 2379]
MRSSTRKMPKERSDTSVSSRESIQTTTPANAIPSHNLTNDLIAASPRQTAQRRLVAQLQDARQFKASKVYAQNITGSYTDALNVVQQLNVRGPYLIFQYKSHPKHVDYDSKVKAALKENGDVPATIPDKSIIITNYTQYGKEA